MSVGPWDQKIFAMSESMVLFDGRNPAPPGMENNPANNGIFTISTG